MNSRRPVSAADTIWLNMDRPTNLMVIDTIMWFDQPVDFDRLTGVIRCRLLDRYPVFRQRAVPSRIPLAPPSWMHDPDFRIERHLRRATLPPPGDDRTLQAFLQEQFSRPLDRAHPLWEIHFVDGYRGGARSSGRGRPGAVVVSRVHHAITDGIALVSLLLSLTDADPAGDEQLPPAATSTGSSAPPGMLQLPLQVAARATEAAAGTTLAALRLLAGLPGTADPRRLRPGIRFARQSAQVAGKLLLSRDPVTALHGTPGGSKLVAWSQPRPVADIKRLARLAGGTVNDVLIAAVSAALSQYLIDHDGEAVDLTTMVPVNVRPPGRPISSELGNRFALVLLRLPTGPRAPLERLAETKRRMDAIKGSPEPLLTFALITAIGRTAPPLERVLVDFFSAKAFGVTTNVPGPTGRRFMAGTPIAGMLGWVPGTARQSVGVSIFSYDGVVRVGFKVDAQVVEAPDKLAHAYEQAIDELLSLVD